MCAHTCVYYKASCYVPGLYVENRVPLGFLSSSVCTTFIHICRGHQFRREFSRISEIRALAPPITNLMALTATATYETRNKIIKALEMDDCKVIAMIPNNLNIYYAVLPLPTSPMCVLSALIEEICSKAREAN